MRIRVPGSCLSYSVNRRSSIEGTQAYLLTKAIQSETVSDKPMLYVEIRHDCVAETSLNCDTDQNEET
jgi:hypothetical protein